MNEEEKNNILNNPELLKISSLDIPLDIAEIAEEFINDELNMEKEEKYLLKDLLRHKKNRDKKPVELYKLFLLLSILIFQISNIVNVLLNSHSLLD